MFCIKICLLETLLPRFPTMYGTKMVSPKKYVLYKNSVCWKPLSPYPPTEYGTNPKNNKLFAQAITGKPQVHLWRVFETKQVDWQLETTIVLLSVAEIYSFAISV